MNNNDLKTTYQTDWAALAAMTDEDIDYSDIPPLTEEFFQNAALRIPATQAHQLIQLDPDILQWFQAQGGEYKSLINSVLRRHIEQGETRSVS
jgi:uncharacterized protein (DUF4415 family)